LKKFAIFTLGCKLNFAESSTISRQFINEGYKRVNFKDNANIYIINTCSVTENADKEFYRLVRLALQYNPNAYIIVVGCYAQIKYKEIMNYKYVKLVLGNINKFNIIDLLKNKVIYNNVKKKKIYYNESYSINEKRTRSFLKIQDGCNYKCSYCTIPLARGISRSDRLYNILRNVKYISNLGVKEIVLTGVNVGYYGKDLYNRYYLYELIQYLDKIKEINRIRISSIEPNLLSDKIIYFIANSKKIMPHFHIPLQSGSNNILKNMKRHYLTNTYYDKIIKTKKIMPYACIGVDIIVGFPGETQEYFLESYRFIEIIDISYINIFTYSERINTEAINIKESIQRKIRYKRNKILQNISNIKRRLFYKSQINTVHFVLFETRKKNGYIYGYTENYIKVKSSLKKINTNSIVKVKLNLIDNDSTMT
jgi:threonylcarbamoyladenosine tRNA methylthiotransferase MtaB